MLPFGRLWYGEPNAVKNAISYAKFRSRSHRAVIRVYDESGNMIETHEHKGDFKSGEIAFSCRAASCRSVTLVDECHATTIYTADVWSDSL